LNERVQAVRRRSLRAHLVMGALMGLCGLELWPWGSLGLYHVCHWPVVVAAALPPMLMLALAAHVAQENVTSTSRAYLRRRQGVRAALCVALLLLAVQGTAWHLNSALAAPGALMAGMPAVALSVMAECVVTRRATTTIEVAGMMARELHGIVPPE
jgi:hypothetical protein